MFNHERFVRGTNIQEIFAQLDVQEPTHAFYLGKELARASLAMTLGKTYRQEGALSWGYLTPPDDAKSEHVQLTQRAVAAAPRARTDGRLNHDAPSSKSSLPAPDPVRCCEQLDGLPYRLFLDSAAPGPRLGRYSFVMADPVAIVRSRAGRRMSRAVFRPPGRRCLAARVRRARVIRALLAPHRADPIDGLPPFQGGAAGYLGYDWGLTLERLPAPRYDDLALDDVVIGLYDWVLAWDHAGGRGVADLHRDSGDG